MYNVHIWAINLFGISMKTQQKVEVECCVSKAGEYWGKLNSSVNEKVRLCGALKRLFLSFVLQKYFRALFCPQLKLCTSLKGTGSDPADLGLPHHVTCSWAALFSHESELPTTSNKLHTNNLLLVFMYIHGTRVLSAFSFQFGSVLNTRELQYKTLFSLLLLCMCAAVRQTVGNSEVATRKYSVPALQNG